MKRNRTLTERLARSSTLVAAIVSLCTVAAAQTAAGPEIVIKQSLQKQYPDVKVQSVRPSSVPGLYEVYTGSELVYADPTGQYLVMGPILNLATHENVTQTRLSDLGRVDFKTLPFKQAIKVVKGNGKRQFAVFSDPDCPYCQALEKSLTALNDYTMYIFLFPIASLHPQATAKAHAIWCSQDRVQAWSQWMLEKKQAPAVATCAGDPIDSLQQFGNQLRINSTPTMFFASGRRVAGAIPAKDIEKELGAAGASAPAGASAAQPAAAPKS